MPGVSDIYSKIRGGKLTASDCVELFGESTVTKGEDHPPHPHAHVAKDGFEYGESGTLKELRAELIWLRAKLNNHYTVKPAMYPTWKKRFPKVQQEILRLEGKQKLDNTEGVHIDPMLINSNIGAKYRLNEPSLPDYSARQQPHSQFQDSETAIMALYYSLNCAAGLNAVYEIMNGWFFSASWDRVCIQSLTSSKGLRKGSIAPAAPEDGSNPSAHPLRDEDIEMVERGAGGAGSAPTPTAAVGRVTTVLDRIGGNQLRVVTHFPMVAWNPPQAANVGAKLNTHDFVQYVSRSRNEREWKNYLAEEPNVVKW
jgi:hypothetical protein